MAAGLRLCAPCLKALEGKGTSLCEDCQRKLETLLARQRVEIGRPDFWIPDEGEGVLVPGRSRMGKSTAMKDWTSKLMEEGMPVFWWDPQREASRQGIERENTPLGPLRLQVTASDLEHTGKWLRVAPKGKAPAVALVPDEEYPSREERAEDFVRVMGQRFLKHKPEGRCVVFVEEAGLLEGHKAAETLLLEMVTTYGKEGVATVICTQSVSMVQELTRRGCRWVLSFNQLDDNDLRALSKLVGPRYARAVERLKPHECVLGDRMNRAAWRDDVSPEEAGAEAAA